VALILRTLPEIEHNAGGNENHFLYWYNLAPISQGGGKLPIKGSPLYNQVIKDWGSFDNMIAYFKNKTAEIKGSGYGWLIWNPGNQRIEYFETHNQKTPYKYGNYIPLLTIDVWEHAYYLDYQNKRVSYLDGIWKIINWKRVEERFKAAKLQPL